MMREPVLGVLLSLLCVCLVCSGQDVSACDETIVATCMLECDYGLSRDSNGCQLCQCESMICQDVQCPVGKVCKVFGLTMSRHKISRCVDSRFPERCHPPMDTGPCKATKSRIYYNSDSDTCESFIYGGCDGNENNFRNIEECNTVCVPKVVVVCEEEAMCQLHCENGFTLDENNCQKCECAPSDLNPFGSECDEPLTTCLMNCEHGFKKDLRGCDLCECQVVCEKEAQCLLACPGGFQKDTDGCDVCRCVEARNCGDAFCTLFCEHGFSKDDNGCEMCTCAEPVCPEFMCARFCKHGFKKDASGCDICDCEKPKCNEMMCARFCKHGFKKDSVGCDICDCEPEPYCPEVMCQMHCPHGFQRDDRGCDICRCRDFHVPCADVICSRYCRYGFKQDPNGCNICQCKEKPKCLDVMCAMYCVHGFEQDDNGCDICRCSTCTPLQCDQVCEYGYDHDRYGCRVCACHNDPCRVTQCDITQVCIVKSQDNCTDCSLQPHCIAIDLVQKIKVKLHFVHGRLGEYNSDDFHSYMKRRMSHLLGTDEDYVRHLLISHPDPQTTALQFFVVSYAYWDLVAAYQKFEMDVKTHILGTSFTYQDVLFTPERRTITAHYYDDPDIQYDDIDEYENYDSSVDMGLIIGCSIAGVIGLVILILVIIFIGRTKKSHDRPSVAYVRAPEPQIVTDKPPIV